MTPTTPLTPPTNITNPMNKSKHLIVMDIDSTLIEEEVIDLLGEEAGVGKEIAQITSDAMNGLIDFRQALARRVILLKDLDSSFFDAVYKKVHFTRGAHELVDEAHRRGWTVGVVSGGFHEIADRLVHDCHIDHCLANRLEVEDGVLTGKTVGDVVTKDLKLATLRQWAHDDGVAMKYTVAMGDGANDIPMILAAGTGIAFCAKKVVQDAAPFAITERNLALALDIIDAQSS